MARFVGRDVFQPSPGAKAGCDTNLLNQCGRHHTFQPAPGAKAGCDVGQRMMRRTLAVVSTLTRRESRVRLPVDDRIVFGNNGFNPHPARKPGATASRRCGFQSATGFNPHPARKPGATCLITRSGHSSRRFNPHPARKPGATAAVGLGYTSKMGFNPHPARKPGATKRR